MVTYLIGFASEVYCHMHLPLVSNSESKRGAAAECLQHRKYVYE